MAELVWGTIGERYFEIGVDRAVLFPKNQTGVAWDGIVSIEESISGGEPRPYYYDGFKYLNVSSAEEFSATIEAFSAPIEFEELDGSKSLYAGLSITQQVRKSFDLTYRTQIGNDVDGANHGYKIHLVYDALASPSNRNNLSISDSVSLTTMSWDISTRPPIVTGIKPTAHFVIDSRFTPFSLLETFENLLYGDSAQDPLMPSAQEVSDLFTSYV